jgi:transcriptional regulator with XRE-family HTH domain
MRRMKNDMVQILRDELTKRVEKNPRYSMRAFAKSLGINIGALSSLLNGKRPLTAKAAEQLCDKLGITPLKKSEIILRAAKRNGNNSLDLTFNRVEIEEEIFRAISDWYHWAILQLVKTEKYNQNLHTSDPKWISRQLQISETEAKLAIDRLLKLKLLVQGKNGLLERTKESITTANKSFTSAALKKWQRQIREKSIFSLENHPIEVRSHTSMTMAIDPKKIKEAKDLIDEFQERLAEFLEKGKKEKVYQLCVSLFPLQTQEN